MAFFAEKWLNGALTSMIAQKAGLGVGSIYRYFKSKDDLITSIYMSLKTPDCCCCWLYRQKNQFAGRRCKAFSRPNPGLRAHYGLENAFVVFLFLRFTAISATHIHACHMLGNLSVPL